MLECDHQITDVSDAAQINTELTAGRARHIKRLKAEVPEPAPVEGENVIACGADTILDNFDRMITWKDFNVTDDNIDFYNQLNRRKMFVLFFECEANVVTFIQQEISFTAFRVIPTSNREKQFFQVSGKYTAFDESPISAAPAGIFNQAL